MLKGQKLSKNSDRNRSAKDFWLRVATDSNAGMNPNEIARRYTNPHTGRQYNPDHIRWILRKLKNF